MSTSILGNLTKFMTQSNPLVIIGSGLAGYHVAKAWRQLDPTTPLVMITQEPGHFYSKPQLSTAKKHGKTANDLIMTPMEIMREQLNAQIFPNATVTHIDPKNKTLRCLTLEGPREIAYRDLVLATGASPKPYPHALDHPRHFRVNHWHDYDNLMAQFDNFKDICLIGSGLIGCEFAHDWSDEGKQITVITPDPYPLSHLVPETIGIGLQKALSARGITWYTERELVNLNTYGSGLDLHLSTGKTLYTDALITAIGLNANTKLAQETGLNTQQGIVVDANLQTSEPHIYALGDCAEFENECRFFIAPILTSARALAKTLHGQPTPIQLPLMPIVLKVAAYPVVLLPPPPTLKGEWQCEVTDEGVKGLFYDEAQQLKGYALSGAFQTERAAIHKTLISMQTEPA